MVKIFRYIPAIFPAMILAGALISPARAGIGDFREVGFRVGFPGATSDKEFMQYEYFAEQPLPFQIDLSRNISLEPGIDIALAALKGENRSGVIFSAGPAAIVKVPGINGAVDFGSRMALLSRSRFVSENLGGKFQFISHLGISFRVLEQVSVGYHFQHMSNASLARPNPGLNLHAFSLIMAL
jgi:hypothetical protein